MNFKLNRLFKSSGSRQVQALNDLHLVIFSDQHKGGGDAADDFGPCKQSYLDALQHYLVHETPYHLLVLGDAEELWENTLDEIEKTHSDVFELEGQFAAQGRYTRLVGNHDNNWYSQSDFKKQLGNYFPGIKVLQGIRYHITDGDQSLGDLFLVHGHQGSLFSDFLWPISRLVVRYIHRPLQARLKYKTTTPSTDANKRTQQDVKMYNWAVHQENVALIAGHTHKTVFTGLTQELASAKERAEPLPAYLAEDQAEADLRVELYQDMDQPCYFNTGCCAFPDGVITGIEVSNGDIRLVKWHRENGITQRTELQSMSLYDVFNKVRNPGEKITARRITQKQGQV
jgi:UDP-2,3-diacylglucosamine pyrophosphatase LpxH